MDGVLELFQCIKVEQLGEEQNQVNGSNSCVFTLKNCCIVYQQKYDNADFLKLFQGIQAPVQSCEVATNTRGRITMRGRLLAQAGHIVLEGALC